ncbi:MAG: AAA family ATPase [Gammaproteobacteria bacterium]|nr:AAA family ATPase [Gammaproteobacteria bacterium]
MLSKLELRGYRGFEKFELADLRPVNLIVGNNNCGKTSILEAVELLASGGRPSAFKRSAMRRSETVWHHHDDPQEPLVAMRSSRGVRRAVLSHFFHGHRCEPGAEFVLSADDSRSDGHPRRLSAKLYSSGDVETSSFFDVGGGDRPSALRYRMDERGPDAVLYLTIENEGGEPFLLPVGEYGALLGDVYRLRVSNGPNASLRFLTLDSFDPLSMREEWDGLQAEGREDEVVESLKTLLPNIASIHFLAGGAGILIGSADGGGRLPIGTFGDGVKRLLALALSFIGSRDGFLLIDEIDTGLHWTVMEDMWRLVVEAAKRSNVQVFATTHSYDCIRGLGSLAKSCPELAKQVSIQKVHHALQRAVSLHDEGIQVAVEQGIEVR